MNYLLTGDDEPALERLIEQELITITYRAKHSGIIAAHSDLSQEELQEQLPNYTVETPKQYRTNDDIR